MHLPIFIILERGDERLNDAGVAELTQRSCSGLAQILITMLERSDEWLDGAGITNSP
jgi:hypothetical protein